MLKASADQFPPKTQERSTDFKEISKLPKKFEEKDKTIWIFRVYTQNMSAYYVSKYFDMDFDSVLLIFV